MRTWSLTALLWFVACGHTGRGGTPTQDATGGAAGAAAADDVTLQPLVCPDGNEPSDDLATQCPELMPEAGSCCGKVQLSCLYPGADDTYHDLALCIDDEIHAPFWQRTLSVDKVVCTLEGQMSELGVGAEACDARVV